MKTEIQDTKLYKEFIKALNIHDMVADDNPFVVKCCKIAEAYAAQQNPDLGGNVKKFAAQQSKIKMPTEEEIEAAEIMQHLKAYGMIHTVTAVKYPEGTHEDFIKRADEWIWRFRSRLTCSEKPNNSVPGADRFYRSKWLSIKPNNSQKTEGGEG